MDHFDTLFPSPRPIDVLEAAGLAHGPFTRQEALRAGISPHGIDLLLAESVVVKPVRNGYIPTTLPDTVETRAACLAKVTAPHVVLVDRTAAWLWGVDAYSLVEASGVVPIDAFSLRGNQRVRRGGVHGGTRTLFPQDYLDLAGVRVSTPVRTAIDLACRLRRYEAMAAIDALMRAQSLSRVELLADLPRHRGRRGVVQARALIQVADSRAESPGESFLRLVMLDEGLPVPDLQVWVHDEAGERMFRLDHAYEELKIGIEYDGEKHHTSDDDRRRDAVRREWLRAHGWIIIAVTKRDLAPDRRVHWVGDLRRARADRLEDLRVRRARPIQRADRLTREQLRHD